MITLCSQCEKENCKDKHGCNAQNWKQLINGIECLDYKNTKILPKFNNILEVKRIA